MLVVALAGVSLWGLRMWRKSARYRVLASRYRERGARLSRMRLVGPWSDADRRRLTGVWRDNIARYGALQRKYERLARYPWLPVSPDPPEPE